MWTKLVTSKSPLVREGSAVSNGMSNSGRVVSAEALLRWRHPRLGLLGPSDFIRLAEESGQIVPIGSWVLRQACAQAVAWHASFPEAAGMEVSVNLSVRQLHHPGLVDDVADAIRDSGLDPRLLTLEITESAVVDDAEATLQTLGKLKELGLRLSIDDFGTGCSALSYLRRFNADVLKVDQSFIQDMQHSDEAAALVWAIASLARAVRLEAVAEGVETMAQLELLTSMGFDRAQGYNWSRPVPPELMERWLVASPRPSADRSYVRVLLVDDQAHMRGAVGVALGASDRYCVVAEAADGLAACDMAARHQPDLVLLDERMPGMSGTESLSRIAAPRWCSSPPTPIVGWLRWRPEWPPSSTRRATSTAWCSSSSRSLPDGRRRPPSVPSDDYSALRATLSYKCWGSTS